MLETIEIDAVLVVYIVAIIFTLVVCLFAAPLGRYLSVVDLPDGERKLHRHPTPLMGGVAFVPPVLVTCALLAFSTSLSRFYFVLIFVIFSLTLLGFMDDRRHVPAVLRLISSSIIVLVSIILVPGIAVTFLSFSFDSQVAAGGPYFLGFVSGIIFTVLCLVGLQNAINMADGHNGLVTGMSLVWSILLMSYAPSHLLPLLLVFAVCIAVVMMFNLAGHLFLGDAGTYGISIIIGLAAIYIYNVSFVELAADAIVLMFILPVLDTLRLMITRSLAGRSPLSSDRRHLHHILQSVRPPPQALAIYLSMIALPSLLARYLPALTLLWLGLIVILYTAIVLGHHLLERRAFSKTVNG